MIWSKLKNVWNNAFRLNRTTARRNEIFLNFRLDSIVCFSFRWILSAVLNAILERNEVADLFFETVTSGESENLIGWTLYGEKKQRCPNSPGILIYQSRYSITLGYPKLQLSCVQIEGIQLDTRMVIWIPHPKKVEVVRYIHLDTLNYLNVFDMEHPDDHCGNVVNAYNRASVAV